MSDDREPTILELCRALADLDDELKKAIAARAAYNKELDAWWARIDATRRARQPQEAEHAPVA